MEPSDAIARLEALVQDDALEEASALLTSLSPGPLPAPDTHLTLAHIAEHTGQIKRAISEYNLALRHQSRPEILQRIAQLHADRGDWPQAIQTYHKLLTSQPDDVTTLLSLGQALEQNGQWPEAKQLYTQHMALDEPVMKTSLRRLQGQLQDTPEPTTDPPDEPPFAPGEMEAVAMAHLFAGREGVYAKQWLGQSGKHGYSPVHEPLTPHVALQHLTGERTVGVYPVRMDQSVLFMAFDFDITRDALCAKHLAGQPQRLSQMLSWVHSAALRLVDLAKTYELYGLIEDSGWKGRHVWFFFQEPIPAIAARRLGQWLLQRLGPLPNHVSVEFFPKQARVSHDKLGNLIKLPLGVHRVTERRCLFLDQKGQPLPDPFVPLHQPKKTPKATIQTLLREIAIVSSQPPPAPNTPQDPQHTQGYGYEQPSTLPPPTVHPDESRELQWLLGHCHVLRELIQSIDAGRLLSPDAQHVLLYTIGHLPDGPALLRHLLASTLNALPAAFPTTRLKGYPISCPKIRRRLPEVAGSVDCHCVFGDTGTYPNPLLHLDALQDPTPTHQSQELQALQIERAVADLMRARQDYQRLHLLMFTLEERIRHWMKQTQSNTLHTTSGTAELGAQQQVLLRVDLPGRSPLQSLLAMAHKEHDTQDEEEAPRQHEPLCH